MDFCSPSRTPGSSPGISQHLGLPVRAQHDRVLGRIQVQPEVQPDDVMDLLDEQGA